MMSGWKQTNKNPGVKLIRCEGWDKLQRVGFPKKKKKQEVHDKTKMKTQWLSPQLVTLLT